MEEDVVLTEQGSSEPAFTPAEADLSGDSYADLLNALNVLSENQNRIIENQGKSLEEFQKAIENYDEDISYISENFERLQEQNKEIIAYQITLIEYTSYLVYLFIALLVGIVLHKVLSVINGA